RRFVARAVVGKLLQQLLLRLARERFHAAEAIAVGPVTVGAGGGQIAREVRVGRWALSVCGADQAGDAEGGDGDFQLHCGAPLVGSRRLTGAHLCCRTVPWRPAQVASIARTSDPNGVETCFAYSGIAFGMRIAAEHKY